MDEMGGMARGMGTCTTQTADGGRSKPPMAITIRIGRLDEALPILTDIMIVTATPDFVEGGVCNGRLWHSTC